MKVTVDSFVSREAGVVRDSGRQAAEFYTLDGVEQITDLHDAIEVVLGKRPEECKPSGKRSHAPMRHPMLPWLAASQITCVRGVGVPKVVPSAPPIHGGTPIPPKTLLYPTYLYDVVFTPLADIDREEQAVSAGGAGNG